jgi:hypothetical protein
MDCLIQTTKQSEQGIVQDAHPTSSRCIQCFNMNVTVVKESG